MLPSRSPTPYLPLLAGLCAILLAAAPPAQAPAAPAPAATPAPAERPPLGDPAPLPDEAPPELAAIDREELREHVYWLADDARAGRYTASKGQLATAEYVADHFKRLGLKPLGDRRGYLQSYPLQRRWIDAATALTFGGTRVTQGFAVVPSEQDKVTVNGRFRFCGKGRAHEVPETLTGTLPVAVFDKVPRGQGPGGDFQAFGLYRDFARRLRAAGAAAGVVVLPGDPGGLGNVLNYLALQPDHARLSFERRREREELPVPLFVLAGEQGVALLAHLGVALDADGQPGPAADDKAAGKLQIVLKQDEKGSAVNVVAVLEGKSRKSEAVVFSAHHDHIGRRVDGDSFNGADDNASGTAGLLEIAQAFARREERPARSIVFLSVSGEELGLWGSAWFAEHPTWPLAKITANVNIDMIGRAGNADGRIALQVTPSREHDEYSTLVREGARLADRFGISLSSGDAYYQRSDHFNFARKGIPVVFFCDGEHPDYHQVSDHADKLDYASMEAIARLAAWTGLLAAEEPGRPQKLGPQPQW